MKKQTILYILLIFLIVSNGFFIFHYLGKPGHRDGKSRFSLVEELNFNEEQQEKYSALRTAHFDRMKSISMKIGSLKEAMYVNVSEKELSEPFLDSITDLIAMEEKRKDLEMFKHFKDVRQICDDDQKQQLSLIVKEAIKRRGKRGKSKKRD